MSVAISSCNPIYRFYISEASSTTYEVFPLNFLSTKLIYTQEKDSIFYRTKFSGSLLFGTRSKVIDEHGVQQNRIDDWSLFWGIQQTNPCELLYLTITKIEGIDISVYWEGIFSTTDGEFDIDKYTFEVTPQVNDDFYNLFENIDVQYNILNVLTVVTTRALTGVIDITYARNRWLMDVIEYLADQIKPGVTISSEFFTNATNYITQSTNHLTFLTIAQKSDIKRPTSSDPAAQAMLSWNELMHILWSMFQVKWNYNGATDVINIEHIGWTGFEMIAGLDLRTQVLSESTNKFSYVKDKMPKYEKFSFMEAKDVNFVGASILYDSKCVNQDNETNSQDLAVDVTTDLEYIIDNVDSISDNGFVILCNYESGGNYYVELEPGKFQSNIIALNMHLSWANLHHRYFRYGRVLTVGNLNSVLTTFVTALKTIKQKDFYSIICTSDNFDPSNYITTELGETYLSGSKAKVNQAELDPSGKIKFSLLYGPADNVASPITDDKWILINEVSCGHFHATLSEAADADLVIEISYVIFDSGGSSVCGNSPPAEWTIPITSTSDEFTIPASDCDLTDMPVDGCIWYLPNTFNIVGRPDWKVGFVPSCNCPFL